MKHFNTKVKWGTLLLLLFNYAYINGQSFTKLTTGAVATSNNATNHISLEDINGDGWIDIFYANRNAINQLFINNGQATLIDFKAGKNPKASFDLTAVYGENLKKAVRTFEKDSPVSLVIEDKIETSESSKLITWQLLTTADVEITPSGALLKQDGKELKVENVTHPELSFSVISLDPAPMELDRQIKGLKRIELRIPAWTCKNGKDQIRIRLSEN